MRRTPDASWIVWSTRTALPTLSALPVVKLICLQVNDPLTIEPFPVT